MTYIVGWRLPGAVFLVADSVVTTIHGGTEGAERRSSAADRPLSSFGERQIREAGLSIEESGKKLARIGKYAVAMCGDADLCRAIADAIGTASEVHDDPTKAIESAIESIRPFHAERSARLFVAVPAAPDPRLFLVSTEHVPAVQEFMNYGSVQAGSIRDEYKKLAGRVLKYMTKAKLSAEAWLACALGAIQGFGVYDYLVPSGVGGAFWGLAGMPESVVWQGDILYVLTSDRTEICRWATTRVREDGLIVQSSDGWSTMMLDSIVSPVASRASLERWFAVGEAAIAQTSWDYVTLINVRFPAVVVAEMRRQQSNGNVKAAIIDGEDGRAMLGIGMTEAVQSLLYHEPPSLEGDEPPLVAVSFIPFGFTGAFGIGVPGARSEVVHD